ncbi:ribosome recycling factor [Gymnopus androsaceus JB14]|uniref:Ribosome recycling factor n=1 Tax=Gymnopus androsaceus JB14 TaxID=1447944 RepID=A0A6A4HLW9_9AGAR|nr:ribosome recycling factor [Gymnopus androsaceus JB14]
MASILRYTALRSSSILRPYSSIDVYRNRIFSYPVLSPILTRSYAKAGKGSKSKQVVTEAVVHEEPVKSGKGPKSTANLVPGSKQPITDPAAQEEYAKTEQKMAAAIDWFRKDCASAETRASGRVTPALLSPVRVKLPKTEQSFRLEEISTVGVRNGSELVVTVFEEESLKHVERALYDAKLPNITPQKLDNRTLKIPIPKPTVDARNALFAAAQRQAEDTRVQIRKHHQSSLKKGKYEKHSIELEEFQKLTDRFVGEVDKILADMKKATGAK